MSTGDNEVTEFIKTTIEGIRGGEDEDFDLLSNVEFELSVVVKKEGKGKFDIAIVGVGGKYEKEAISKIKFSMGNYNTMYNESRLRKAGKK